MHDEPIAVVGPGRMGVGIALTFATAGFAVRVLDVKERTPTEREHVRARSIDLLLQNLSFLADITDTAFDDEAVLGRVTFSHLPQEALPGCAFVFEAVPEKPELKVRALRLIEPYMEPAAVVGSTTSTIDLATLCHGLERPDRLVITHWLNPAFLIPVVELAHAEGTAPEAVDRMRNLLSGVGKLPVLLRDSPGFIVPRIQALAMNEGVRMLEEGVASAEDIDKAITFGFAFRLCCMGLMEFIDIGGLDILYNADDYLAQTVSQERFTAPETIRRKMQGNELGIKTGKGIYDWRGVDVPDTVRQRFRLMYRLGEFLAEELDGAGRADGRRHRPDTDRGADS